jgi:hypothetical protein
MTLERFGSLETGSTSWLGTDKRLLGACIMTDHVVVIVTFFVKLLVTMITFVVITD